MLIVNVLKSQEPPLVILESDMEFAKAAEAVKDVDPSLAEQLGSIATLVHDEGVRPDSTRLEGHASLEVMAELGKAASHDLFARLLLEDARHVQLDADEIIAAQEWPEDLVAHLNSLDEGPYSAPVGLRATTDDPEATGVFKVKAQLQNEAQALAIAQIDALYAPMLLEARRLPDVIA